MHSQEKKYKLGLALSGGGARGFAHIGAMMALREAGLTPDIVAGVSAGSVAAVMYAAGLTPEEMMAVFEGKGVRRLVDFSLKGGGMFSMDKFRRLILKAIAPYKRIEDLPVPTLIGVTNLDTARWEGIASGNIGEVMQASCSIPVIFKPVRINGHNYVDGGVMCNLPARAIRDRCERLLAVNVSTGFPTGELHSVVDVAIRTYNLFTRANQRPDAAVADLCVEMREISGYRIYNLRDIAKVCTAGYTATRHALRENGWWPDSQ